MLFMHFSLFQIVASFDYLTDLSGDSYCDDSAYSYQQNAFLIDWFINSNKTKKGFDKNIETLEKILKNNPETSL